MILKVVESGLPYLRAARSSNKEPVLVSHVSRVGSARERMQGARRRPWLIPRPSRATPQTPLAEPTLRDRTDLPSFVVVASSLGLDPTTSAPPRLKANPSRSRPRGIPRQAPGRSAILRALRRRGSYAKCV